MLKYYIKIGWKVFTRKKLFSIISLYGIISPLVFMMLIISFINHISNYSPPFSKGKQIFYLQNIRWIEYDKLGNKTRDMGNSPSYSFICNQIKTMKSSKKVSAISIPQNDTYVYQNGIKKKLIVKYTDSEFWEITNNIFVLGRPFNKHELEQAQPYAVIDEQTAYFYFGNNNPINRTVAFDNKNYTIIGVVKNVDITNFRISANVYLPFTTNNSFTSTSIFESGCYALILAGSHNDLKKINTEFQSIIEKYDYTNASGCNGMISEIEKPSLLRELSVTLWELFTIWSEPYFTIGFILSILFFLVLPAINLVNINLNRISERQSEIGLRKSYGSTSNNLLLQFISESLLFTFAGAAIALILTLAILNFINTSGLFPGCNLKIDFIAFLYSNLLVLFFGLLSGAYPAWKMSRKNIVTSLNNNSI